MNSKVTFPELVDAVAAANDCPKRVSEMFLKELFTVISDALRNGESVRVRGLGLFKLTNVEARKSVNVNTGEEMEIPSHRKVTFVPEKGLADAINAPFAGFETVVLDDSLTEEELQRLVAEDEPQVPEAASAELWLAQDEATEPEPAEEAGKLQAETPKPPMIEIKPEDTPELADEKVEDTKPSDDCEEDMNDNRYIEKNATDEMRPPVPNTPEVIQPAYSGDYNIPEDDDEEEYVPERAHSSRNDGFVRGFIWGALTMFALYLVVGGSYYMWQHMETQKIIDTARGTDSIAGEEAIDELIEATAPSESPQPEPQAAPSEGEAATAAPEAAKPAPESPKAKEPVYDEVTERQFLSKIATKHYGHPDFWVYIYEENRDIIKNPNTIAPGTRVVVPPAEKYGIDKKNKGSLRAAGKKIEEIEKGKK